LKRVADHQSAGGALDKAMSVIDLLANEVGPRRPTDRGERLAAALMRRRLLEDGIDARIEPFRGYASFGYPYGLIQAAALLPSLLPWRTVAQEKGLEWQTDIASDLPEVEIDPDRMSQVIGNLISNAIKYTPQGGAIAVTADASKDVVNFGICDTGPGIDPEEQERIFEPFYRSQAHRRFPQGLGLGLTIARDLVEVHGGTLELVSEPGEGSCFTIHLPRNSQQQTVSS